MSCERLRALLPQFDGRREDMASVLEMSVCFLQLAHSMDPSWEQLSVSPKQAGLVRPLQPVYYGMSWFGSIVPPSSRAPRRLRVLYRHDTFKPYQLAFF